MRVGVTWIPCLIPLAMACSTLAAADEGMHTIDGKSDLGRVEVTIVYLVPHDRAALPDWRDRVGYFARRVELFHHREFDGQSTLTTKIHLEPLKVEQTADEIRGKDPDQTFFRSTTAAREALGWPGERRRDVFPTLLVLSEINWRELDDFRRVRTVDGAEVHEGAIGEGGRHFPGAESGGARAVYDPDLGGGYGLVSADGWRVPYSGSDCAVYHEGVGHPIGLPHPEPIDGSVMGVAQYQGWINETFVNESQKKALGWKSPDRPRPGPTLFDAFAAIPSPAVPAPGRAVALALTWPGKARVKSLRVLTQVELRGPWREVAVEPSANPPARVAIGTFDRATPVSYRVLASLEDGQDVELWGYFQVK